MRLGSTFRPGPPPSMARAGFSALVLLVGIIVVAKTVMVAPVIEAEAPSTPAPTPRAATRQVPVRPSATRLSVPTQALGSYRMGTAHFRAISEPQEAARPIH